MIISETAAECIMGIYAECQFPQCAILKSNHPLLPSLHGRRHRLAVVRIKRLTGCTQHRPSTCVVVRPIKVNEVIIKHPKIRIPPHPLIRIQPRAHRLKERRLLRIRPEPLELGDPNRHARLLIRFRDEDLEPADIPRLVVPVHGLKIGERGTVQVRQVAVELLQPDEAAGLAGDGGAAELDHAGVGLHVLDPGLGGVFGRHVRLLVVVGLVEAEDPRHSVVHGGFDGGVPGCGQVGRVGPEHGEAGEVGVGVGAEVLAPVVEPGDLGGGAAEEVG